MIGGSSRPQARGARPSKRARIGPPSASASRVSLGALEQRLEPALRREDVVVDERDQRRPCLAHAGVAGRVEAAPFAVAHAAHPEARGDLGGGVGGSVVDHEELVRFPRALGP